MVAIDFNGAFKAFLATKGFSVDVTGVHYFKEGCQTTFEPPVHLASADFYYRSLNIGAFSYAVSGQLMDVDIGRYVSIAANVSIGLGSHPTDHITTSPIPWTEMSIFENFVRQSQPDARANIRSGTFQNYCTTFIGHDVWIGQGSYIKDGVSIGHGAIVGAHAVVTKNVSPYSIVGGNPARLIRMRFDDKTIEALLELQWWNYSLYELPSIDFSQTRHAIEVLQSLKKDDKLIQYNPEKLDIVELYSQFQMSLSHT